MYLANVWDENGVLLLATVVGDTEEATERELHLASAAFKGRKTVATIIWNLALFQENARTVYQRDRL